MLIGTIEPVALTSGQPFSVGVVGASKWAGQTIQVVIDGSDEAEIMWLSSLSAEVDDAGRAMVAHPGLEVVRETVIWVTAAGPENELEKIETVALSIVGSPEPVPREQIVARHQAISARREATRRQPIGAAGPGLTRFRSAFIVENLLITARIDTRHGSVHPLPIELLLDDLRAAANSTLEMLGWPTRVDDANWNTNMRRRDIAAIEFPEVWASDWDDAFHKTLAEAERTMSAVAFLRHAAPMLALVVLEQDVVPIVSKLRSLRAPYQGNLAGGPPAGESQSAFSIVDLALENDPKFALYVSLYLDAKGESETNSKYFKLWSVLETIAINNVADGQPVALEDGTMWPNGETTGNAGPRVFELLRSANLPARAWPGGDLYTFVRAVYGRRNATAHYGRFVETDPVQQAKRWYPWAVLTLAETADQGDWVWNLELLVHEIVANELRRLP